MPKRVSGRHVKAARTYTLDEAARAAGVTIGTIRTWAKQGLRVMNEKRPYLILGDDQSDD